jgi:hypothetical protein
MLTPRKVARPAANRVKDKSQISAPKHIFVAMHYFVQ